MKVKIVTSNGTLTWAIITLTLICKIVMSV
jgi:hypothetical protein